MAVSIEAWSKRYGVDVAHTRRLRRLVNKYAKENEASSNGDPHPDSKDRKDKNANSELWSKQLELTSVQIVELASKMDFGVDFGIGLYPVFSRGNEDSIHCP